MAELYVKPNIADAFAIGKKVAEYGMSDEYGPTDLHTVDAFLELGQHINGLTRDHVDENEPGPVFAGEPCFEKVATILDEAENQPLAAADGVSINPAQILAILQAAKMLAQLLGIDLPFLSK